MISIKAVELRAKIESGSYSTEDEEDVKKFSEELRKLENRKSKGLVLPHDFGHRLSEKLMIMNACNVNENGGIVEEIILMAKQPIASSCDATNGRLFNDKNMFNPNYLKITDTVSALGRV